MSRKERMVLNIMFLDIYVSVPYRGLMSRKSPEGKFAFDMIQDAVSVPYRGLMSRKT